MAFGFEGKNGVRAFFTGSARGFSTSFLATHSELDTARMYAEGVTAFDLMWNRVLSSNPRIVC